MGVEPLIGGKTNARPPIASPRPMGASGVHRRGEEQGGDGEALWQAQSLGKEWERGALERECHGSLTDIGELKHQKMERLLALRKSRKFN